MANAIRAFVGPAAQRFTDRQLEALVGKVGGVPLACDVLSAIPQPSWLEGFMHRV
jgi:hypothetical protein